MPRAATGLVLWGGRRYIWDNTSVKCVETLFWDMSWEKCEMQEGARAPSARHPVTPLNSTPPHSYPLHTSLYILSDLDLFDFTFCERCRHKAIPINYFVCRSVLCTVQAPKSICLNYPSWSRGWRQCTRPADSYAKTHEKGRIVHKHLHTYLCTYQTILIPWPHAVLAMLHAWRKGRKDRYIAGEGGWYQRKQFSRRRIELISTRDGIEICWILSRGNNSCSTYVDWEHACTRHVTRSRRSLFFIVLLPILLQQPLVGLEPNL